MLVTIDTYFQPNKTIRDLHEMMNTRGGVDPFWEFSDAARAHPRALPHAN